MSDSRCFLVLPCRTAGDKIQDLEKGLQKAIALTEHLERVRQETERNSEARLWDLKEKLDYANTTKKRCVLNPSNPTNRVESD